MIMNKKIYVIVGGICAALATVAAAPTYTGLLLRGSSSGVVTIQPGAAAAGTYNYNLPVTAGTTGQVLTSGGGTTNPMTWTTLGGGSGTVLSVGGTSTGGTLTPTGGPVTTSGSLNFELNLAHANTWTATQTFTGSDIFSGSVRLTGISAGTQVACLGLDSSNFIVLKAACGSGGGGSVSVTAGTPNVVITPSPGTGTFTIGTTTPLNTQSGSSYTVLAGDLGKTVVRSASGAQTDTVPQATGSFAAGSTFDLQTLANGDTLTPTTSAANGLPSIKLGARQFSEWTSDGTNWNVSLGLPQPATQTHTTVLYDDMTWASPSLITDTTHGGSFTLSVGNQDTLTGSGTVTIPTLTAGQSVMLVTATGATATLTKPGGVTLAGVLSQTTLGPLSFMSCVYNSGTVYDCTASSQIVTDEICATWDSTTSVTAQTIDFPISWSSYTISKVKTKVGGGGSFSVAVKIGGTNVTSCSAISVSGSTNTNTSCTAANTGAVDDIVSVVVSSPAGTVNQAYVCPVFAHAVN